MTAENQCEQIEVALLQAQAGLVGFTVAQFDTDTHADMDRIVVKARPREVAVSGPTPSRPKIFRVPVDVAAILVTRDSAEFDALVAAIQAANILPYAAAGQSLGDGFFPSGWTIEHTDDGSRENEPNTRERLKTFNFLFGA